MLRIGVAGLGGMGFLHARNALGIAGAQLTAVASTRPDRPAEASLEPGVARDVRTPEPEDPLPAGGFLVDMASHDYDAACWFLGQKPVEAYAARQSSVYPELEPLGDLDNAAVTVRFDGGGIAALHVSRTCAWGHDVRVEIVGDEGSIFVGNASSRDGVYAMTREGGVSFP